MTTGGGGTSNFIKKTWVQGEYTANRRQMSRSKADAQESGDCSDRASLAGTGVVYAKAQTTLPELFTRAHCL